MDWINTTSTQRIVGWRQFRIDVQNKESDNFTILKDVVEFWASVPRGSRCVDYYSPESWPTPWEILNDQLYCENTVSLMIYYTLECIDNYTGTLEILLIDDKEDEYLAVLADDTYLLNFQYGEVVKMCDIIDIKVIQRFKKEELREVV